MRKRSKWRWEEGEKGGRGGKLLTTMQRPELTVAGPGINRESELV